MPENQREIFECQIQSGGYLMDDRTIKDGPGLKWRNSKKTEAQESGRT